MAKNQSSEKVNPFKKSIINLPFHDFEKNSKFLGLFHEKIELGDAPEEGKEDKRFNVNIFSKDVTGEQVFVTDSYSIAKAIDQAKAENIADPVFEIEFLGKTTVKGKPFNQFSISVCSLSAYQEFIK